jgi:hypothetical protein
MRILNVFVNSSADYFSFFDPLLLLADLNYSIYKKKTYFVLMNKLNLRMHYMYQISFLFTPFPIIPGATIA